MPFCSSLVKLKDLKTEWKTYTDMNICFFLIVYVYLPT